MEKLNNKIPFAYSDGYDNLDKKIFVKNDSLDRYMKQIKRYGKTISKEEAIDLAKIIDLGGPEGKKARKKLINRCLYLVVKIAKRFNTINLSLMDLISEGNLGLLEAISKNDWRKNLNFEYFASWRIRKAIQRSIEDKDKTIRIPAHLVEKINKLEAIEKEFSEKLGRDPYSVEIGKDLDVEKLRDIRAINDDLVPLDALGDIEDHDADDPVALASNKELLKLVFDVLADVEKRKIEREILIKRLRLNKKEGIIAKEYLPEELAKEFNLPVKRIRDIQLITMTKLRQLKFQYKFIGFIEDDELFEYYENRTDVLKFLENK